jgi:hypothetical protein
MKPRQSNRTRGAPNRVRMPAVYGEATRPVKDEWLVAGLNVGDTCA